MVAQNFRYVCGDLQPASFQQRCGKQLPVPPGQDESVSLLYRER